MTTSPTTAAIAAEGAASSLYKKRKKHINEKDSTRKRKRSKQDHHHTSANDDVQTNNTTTTTTTSTTSSSSNSAAVIKTPPPRIIILPPHQYIVAPMVGASELAFRLLCRKYGAQLCYTPMMSASQFVNDARNNYRRATTDSEIFQTIPEDRPLVCHFAANEAEDLAAAARLVEPHCDAIDLNLGCPQRTAYVGHFGSYLLGRNDRGRVLDMVRAAARAVTIPIFVKIRLLDTLQETMELCRQLRDAGASLIAVHARYRASFERKGPGARDGPAMLDQVAAIKSAVPDVAIISNGNTISYEDVVNNLEFTKADGVMSAEGILDNPALFLPRLGSRDDPDQMITIADPSPLPGGTATESNTGSSKKRRKLLKRLRQIEDIEMQIKVDESVGVNEDQRAKLKKKSSILAKLAKLDATESATNATDRGAKLNVPATETISLGRLYEVADSPIQLVNEYLSLARRYPTKLRTVVFHTRRMLKDLLNRYQLMEECVSSESLQQVQDIVNRCQSYMDNPNLFVFDREKAKEQKEALERKRRQEQKRKDFEARMRRKAKREGKTDLDFYLRIGAEVPTTEIIQKLKSIPREAQLQVWKKSHSQHCMAFHLEPGGCKRDRACAFLHVDAKRNNSFVESEEVAG